MKILMVISQFHPLIGGTEKQAQLLAKKLVGKGVHVNIVTGWWNLGTPRKEMVEGIRVVRNFCCWGMFGARDHQVVRMFGGLIYVISLTAYLFIHGRKYDFIHVHQYLYPAFISVFIGKKFLKKPVLVKSASSGATSDIELLKRFPLGNYQLKYLLKELDYLVAISKATGKDFMEIGYPESRISYIPNGVKIPPSGKAERDRSGHVLSVSRLSREKGIDVLLKAWALVVQEENKLKLTILGDGPLHSEMKRLSQSLRLDHWVEFIGMVNNVEEHLCDSDLFVLPSRNEGMSNALLEAMSHGIPCIATDVGGNAELLGGKGEAIPAGGYFVAKNGLLINPDDPKGLSEAILFLIKCRSTREAIGKKSRIFIQENYSIDRIADQYISLYQSILNKRV